MSQETLTWLNQNTLIGFTSKRGNAWHYRASDQGAEQNHYVGAIPVDDVKRRLFHWRAVEAPISAKIPPVMDANGVGEAITITDPTRKVIVRPDTRTILGVFRDGYTIHHYDEWLLETVASILDDELSIGSAGLLKGGAVAWVQVEVPETITTPEGVDFRPHLTAATSCDGSLATTMNRAVQVAVCDNTLSAALGERGQSVKVKHSRYSRLRLQDARDALAIIHTVAADFTQQVADLCSVTVTDAEYDRFLHSITPMPEGSEPSRSRTMAEGKHEAMNKLWRTDTRVAPWKNTAFGVVQAVNTFTHHEQIVRGAERAERNQLRAVKGEVDTLDRDTLDRIMAIIS